MDSRFDRTISLIGEKNLDVLRRSEVLLVGVGGVGGAAAEALVRAGVGGVTFIDGDVFEPSNLNRQILCTTQNIGKNKASEAAKRAKEIFPDIRAVAVESFLTAQNIGIVERGKFDYCIDAIDDIKNKLLLIERCKATDTPIVSAMGAGNRLSCDFRIADIFDTEGDPFARKLRHELRKMNIDKLDVACAVTPPAVRFGTPASIAPPPFVMGAMLAGFVIGKLINIY